MTLELLTLQNFKIGKFFESFPWFGKLKEIIENDSHHAHDSVFNHTVNVALSIESLVCENQIYSDYFSRKLHGNSRRRLLEISAIFHDVGKSETGSFEGSRTSFKGHEEVSFNITQGILKHIDMSEIERSYICNIIRYHGRLFQFLREGNQSIQKDFHDIEEALDCFPDLYLFALADINGSQLKDKNPSKYNFMIEHLRSRLTEQILKPDTGVLENV